MQEKSLPYYLKLERWMPDIYKIAEHNELSLGRTLKMLILLGLNEYHKQLGHFNNLGGK